MKSKDQEIISLETEDLWEKIYTVNPLVIIGSTDPDGEANFAPKHMAFSLGWDAYFGFVCTPRHSTYQNIRDKESFTVTYPKPDQVVISSITASQRQTDDTKPELQLLDRFPATHVEDHFLSIGYLYLECRLERIEDGFGKNSLILGRIIAAHADIEYLRDEDKDDNDLIFHRPLLAYLYPGRFSVIRETHGFPFPEHFSK